LLFLNRPVAGNLRGHQEQRTPHGRAHHAKAKAVEVFDSLLAQAEVGRGIASRKGGVQSRAKLAEEGCRSRR